MQSPHENPHEMTITFPYQMTYKFPICKWKFFVISSFAITEEITYDIRNTIIVTYVPIQEQEMQCHRHMKTLEMAKTF